MNGLDIDKYIGLESMLIVDAMKKIDSNSIGLLYIVNRRRKLVGCLSDGDIRRWLLKTGNLSSPVVNAMNCNPKYIYKNERKDIYKKIDPGLRAIAVVNYEKVIEDVVIGDYNFKVCNKLANASLKDTTVIIMAGGKGTRLYPYTKILPKPLIPIGDVPIIERIINRFCNYGVQDFYITLNYRKEMIKSYFSEVRKTYNVNFVEEVEPLGTAGSITLIEKNFEGTVIVTNCDIIIDTDYNDVLDYHKSSGNSMTIVSSSKYISVPYGVLHTREQGIVESMEEKPGFSCLINTGMYFVEPHLLKLLPKNRFYHMTNFVEDILKSNEKVGMYPISENSFLDMGELEEMRRMEERVSEINAKC